MCLKQVSNSLPAALLSGHCAWTRLGCWSRWGDPEERAVSCCKAMKHSTGLSYAGNRGVILLFALPDHIPSLMQCLLLECLIMAGDCT